jgi:hypothetical protein
MSETDNQSQSWWQDHRAAIRDAETVRADLFVRSLGVPVDSQSCQTTAICQLDELESDGPVTTTTVRIWGDRIYPEDRCAETPAGRFILDKIEEMEAWAEQREEVQLQFQRERATSTLTDEPRMLIRLPCYCLSVYLDGALSAVFPCSVNGEDCGVLEYFDMLQRLSETAVPAPSASADPAKIQ